MIQLHNSVTGRRSTCCGPSYHGDLISGLNLFPGCIWSISPLVSLNQRKPTVTPLNTEHCPLNQLDALAVFQHYYYYFLSIFNILDKLDNVANILCLRIWFILSLYIIINTSYKREYTSNTTYWSCIVLLYFFPIQSHYYLKEYVQSTSPSTQFFITMKSFSRSWGRNAFLKSEFFLTSFTATVFQLSTNHCTMIGGQY